MAQRIASLLASATEMLYALGLGERVVAISHECDYPPATTVKPRVTAANVDCHASSGDIDRRVREFAAKKVPMYRIDVDRLAGLAPDIIVTQAECDVCAVRYEDVLNVVRGSSSLANTQIVSLNPVRLGDIFDDVLRVGEAAGAAARAAEVVGDMRARVEVVAARTRRLPADRRPRVACLEWIDPPMLAGNWMPELIELAGGRCELVRPGAHSGPTTWEVMASFDPQVIVVMPCGFDLARAVQESRRLRQSPGWAKLSAVESSRVFAVDGNAYFNRSGPRIVDSMEILAGLIHPAEFAVHLETYRGAWCSLAEAASSLHAPQG